MTIMSVLQSRGTSSRATQADPSLPNPSREQSTPEPVRLQTGDPINTAPSWLDGSAAVANIQVCQMMILENYVVR